MRIPRSVTGPCEEESRRSKEEGVAKSFVRGATSGHVEFGPTQVFDCGASVEVTVDTSVVAEPEIIEDGPVPLDAS